MQATQHQKLYFLDYLRPMELCTSALPGQENVLIEKPVGTGLCALLNAGVPTLTRLRARLNKLMPLQSQDIEPYAVMLSIKLGNTPLPDSEFAAALFSVLDQIAELDDLFYVALQMNTLLNLFEEDAPQKNIVRAMAATASRAAIALDMAIAELPLYQKRVDSVFSHTALDETEGEEIPPVLTRALNYQIASKDLILQFRGGVVHSLFARQNETISEIFAETAEPQAGALFLGNSLSSFPISDMLRLLFQQMLLADTVVRVCGVCGRYFVPAVRSNEKYCDFLSPESDGATLTCKQRSTKSRLETDSSLKLLKGAYDKNFIKSGRKRDTNYRDLIFRPWYSWAKQQRARYLSAEMSLEALSELLRLDMEGYLTPSTPLLVDDVAVEAAVEAALYAESDAFGEAPLTEDDILPHDEAMLVEDELALLEAGLELPPALAPLTEDDILPHDEAMLAEGELDSLEAGLDSLEAELASLEEQELLRTF